MFENCALLRESCLFVTGNYLAWFKVVCFIKANETLSKSKEQIVIECRKKTKPSTVLQNIINTGRSA